MSLAARASAAGASATLSAPRPTCPSAATWFTEIPWFAASRAARIVRRTSRRGLPASAPRARRPRRAPSGCSPRRQAPDHQRPKRAAPISVHRALRHPPRRVAAENRHLEFSMLSPHCPTQAEDDRPPERFRGVPRPSLPQRAVCPAAPCGQRISSTGVTPRIPSPAEITTPTARASAILRGMWRRRPPARNAGAGASWPRFHSPWKADARS